MKFGFVTCVELGLACMEEIYSCGERLELAITLRDDVARSKSGRVYLDDFCAGRGINLIKTRHINDAEAVDAIRSNQIDWLFIIGWSQIAGQMVLDAPARGVLGMHPTLLPQGRGRAPIPWAILKGLRETGVTLFRLDAGVDTGDIVGQVAMPISETETATSLYARIADAHRTLLRRSLPALSSDDVQMTRQNESEATFWPQRRPEDGRITPHMTVEQADRLVRATTRPYPGAFWVEDGRSIRIWSGHAAGTRPARDTALRLTLLDGVYEATDFEET
jgi:methionyl-tRNA formyltransferase